PVADGERELDLLPLTVIADRCRVKGDACQLVARRLADPAAGRDPAAEADVARRALALPDCNLWMLTREPVVEAPRAWEDLAGAFAVAAAAALLLRDWGQAPAPVADRHASRVLGLAAEAQSVLLYAVADVRDVKVDFDQVQLFAHIRSTARDRQVFIPKYLKREDRAAPESWPDMARRVAEAAAQFRMYGERDRTRHKALSNLKYKLSRLRDRPDESAGEWPRVLELVDTVVAGGLPPSNPELRDLLLPVLEEIPDDPPPPPNVQLVLREIDRYVETRPDAEPPARPHQASAEVGEVAGLLRGREVVLIGGQARPAHKAALMRAFGLADVRWLCTPDHTSFTVFEPDVARPEVAVVLLAIRWSNHDYDGVRAYCEAYGKPLVRLPGGYNANQVAHHILSQAGDRLRATKAAAG
ncbi:MAG: hypothetical protein JWO38_6342, partial [Gemmataceae bacterium]|nr:hypothetical protein [Gemmataceae bacterium]